MTDMMQQYLDARAARERDLAARATDADFRARLIAEPRATLAAIYGVAIPESADVRVVEDAANTHYVVLPPSEFGSDAELTEDQLEAVAGGWFVQLIATSICFGGGDPGGVKAPDPK